MTEVIKKPCTWAEIIHIVYFSPMDTKQKASLFAVCSASALACCKFGVGYSSGSMAVVSSGLDSLLDVFMSAMNFYAIRKAAEPADQSHPYGHGKAEDIAGIFQTIVVVLSGSAIIYKAVEAFLRKGAIAYSVFDFLVMSLSLAFSAMISVVLVRMGKRTGSNALKADALHYTSDLYSNSGTIIAILLTYFTGITLFDLAFAAIVGAIIIFFAVKIFRNSISGVMDSSIAVDLEKKIKRIIGTKPYPTVGYHKLRTRYSGIHKYIDFHLLFCRKLTIDEAHTLATGIESEISEEVKPADVTVHMEPCERDCDLTEATCSMLGEIPGKERVRPVP
jgi:ferrous-iron efflux pump FieF